jgi:hypothetical protein
MAAAACDESFEPTAASEFAFSVFGYLDASADTQWIRVMPMRSLRVTTRDPLGVTVTLEELGTGRIIELEDSLFTFSSYSDSALGAEGAYVHNFWTTVPIEPGATYRFVATRAGREPAEAVVEIPRDYEVEVAIKQSRGWLMSGVREPDTLRVTGVTHLPFLTATAHFYTVCGPGLGARVLYSGRSADDGIHAIAIQQPVIGPWNFRCHLDLLYGGYNIAMHENRVLWIVGSEAAWPTSGYSESALGEANWTSNVTNAVGYLGGILTKLLPYEDCSFQSYGAPIPDYCVLRYNGETAMLTGTVTETHCGDGLMPSPTVRLTEIGPDPARIRSVRGTRAGEFVIGLDPGIPHGLWVRATDVVVDSARNPWTGEWEPIWGDVHTHHTDILTLMPGQVVEYDMQLERLTQCNRPPRYTWP